MHCEILGIKHERETDHYNIDKLYDAVEKQKREYIPEGDVTRKISCFFTGDDGKENTFEMSLLDAGMVTIEEIGY
jgi:hypothetical protein